ncbi:MAG: c-type cytochrome [Leptolyngbya sp. SIO1E4]|nr:c-type cytochrome [Leptolyngbya sp. SIO1E4]
MKKLLVGLCGAVLCWLAVIAPASAADLAEGGQVFASNCAACHIGGGNVVNAAKTLKIADLNTYEMASIEAIKTQVTNGKNAMPAFKGRLTDSQIDSVAAYVLDQAEKGW